MRPLLNLLALSAAALLLLLAALGVGEPGAPRAPAAPAPIAPDLVRPADLVTAQRGALPIILSAPHGGLARVPGSKDRTRGTTVRDVNTGEIALLVAQRLTAKLGAKPSFVVAQFSRKDADANRSPDSGEAYETPAARAHYDAYHAALRACVDDCLRTHGRAILIDFHGQARAPSALVRGTRNGKTVKALTDRAGDAALNGPDSLFGRLKAAGYDVLPDLTIDEQGKPAAVAPDAPRETFFDGGYIVAHYGSDQPRSVDAIQVEIGSERSRNLFKLSRDLADAIAGFYTAYYAPPAPPAPAPAQPDADADEPATVPAPK